MKKLFWTIENLGWSIRCKYNLWLHGPYGLAKVIEKIPFRFLIKYLRKYGAEIGKDCRFERGINIHRPLGNKPFQNLVIGDGVYLGHGTLIDLTEKVTIKDKVIVASGCQIWTHASRYGAKVIDDPQYDEKTGPVTICEAALIYSGVVISHGVSVGSFSIIGANSVISRDIEPGVFAGGAPAIKIRAI